METLKTQRLVFRQYLPKDKLHFIELFTDNSVMRYVGNGVLDAVQAYAFWNKLHQKLYPDGYNIWAIFTRDKSIYLGHAGIYPRPKLKDEWEFIYLIKHAEWGKGYATETAERIIKFGFEDLGKEELFATIDDENINSIKAAEKAGMNFRNYEFDEKERFSVFSIKKTSV